MQSENDLTQATQQFFEQIKSNPKEREEVWDMNEDEFKKNRAAIASGFSELAAAPCPDVEIEEQTLSIDSNTTLDITRVIPKGMNTPSPTLIYFPGVAFTLNLNMHHVPCSYMAKESGWKIIIINCKLAPEYKHPHGPNQAYEAIKCLYKNADQFGINQDLFAIGGDSSGGNFAALATIKLTKDNPEIKIKFQLLISPNTDESLETYEKTPFKKYQDRDIMVTENAIRFFRDLYLPEGTDPKTPEVSPLFADLTGLTLPPTIMSCAQFDGVRGDTEAYFDKLKETGNDVEKIIWQGQVHNSMLCRKVLHDGENPAITIGKAIKDRMDNLNNLKEEIKGDLSPNH